MSALKPLPEVITPILIIAEDPGSTLPLEHTEVSAQINGPAAAVVVTQRFGNPLEEAAELEYLYPLPEDAAITGFVLRTGDRRIQGSLRELQAAREAYETAREAGKRAGLLEQRRPNLFSVRLANVRPGETIYAELRYQQRLKFEDDALGGGYEFVFPMGLTPKYDSAEHPKEGEGVHAPVTKHEKTGPVEIHLSADMGFAVREVSSPSHAVEVVQMDERRVQVRLAREYIPDHDFVLRFLRVETGPLAAAWTSGEGDSATFLATLIPPVLEDDPQPVPREYIFVLDRSGSMSGAPIRQARNALRACLRTLNEGDSFAILLFDNRLEWVHQEAVPVTQENINAADAFLDGVEGRGGTEIVRALEAALNLADDPRRGRVIVFLTDGAVSAEARLLDQLREKIGSTRMFTFGIGPSVNRALISRMAVLGRGRAQFLQLDEDIEGAIIRFQDSISFPALTDLSLSWQSGEGMDVYPARLPDLYHGQPLEICGRVKRGVGLVRLTVHGSRGGTPVTLAVDIPQPAGKDAALERIWARARVDNLFEQTALEPGKGDDLRKEILELALEHQLVTPLTAFVAVDPSEETLDGKPRLIRVAQPLPEGLDPGGFGRPAPIMAAGFMPVNTLMNTRQKLVSENRAGSDALSTNAVPAFLMRRDSSNLETRDAEAATGAKLGRGTAGTGDGAGRDPKSLLRWLARTQNLDGSWQEDVERTAAALLAFIRAGSTPRKGSFRQAVRRSARWLIDHPGTGWADFARVLALEALANATGEPADRKTAEEARKLLPAPVGMLQKAAYGLDSGQDASTRVPDMLESLDDLRLAVISGVHRSVSDRLLRGPNAELALTWAAGLPDGID